MRATEAFWYAIAFTVSCGFAVARVSGVDDNIFKAMAHVYVGTLIGIALGRRSMQWAWQPIILSVIETATAVLTRLL
jgi:hypothetical protein